MSSYGTIYYLIVSRTVLFVMQSMLEIPGMVLSHLNSFSWIFRSSYAVTIQRFTVLRKCFRRPMITKD